MKLKKVLAVILLTVMFLTQFSFLKFDNSVYAVEENANIGNFHYNQLNDVAKKIYNAMYKMYTQGIFKTGNGDYDLVANGDITSEEARQYEKGSNQLDSAMSAAKYAFYADYPELFYVDFANIGIRVTKDAQNGYHVYLGAVMTGNYLIKGFSPQSVESAIQEYNNRVDEIAQGARDMEIKEGKNPITERIKYVHNEIIYNAEYKTESDCSFGNSNFLNTPYGTLVRGESVCEGYARAFKSIMDKLGIQCIVVQGLHITEDGNTNPHMWNYVQIEENGEKSWYAVDCTVDDPYVSDKSTLELLDVTLENTRYLLIGEKTMSAEHIAVETVNAAGNYKFTYPDLQIEDYATNIIVDEKGLIVKLKEDGTETGETKAGDLFISYNEKGYARNVEEDGIYFISRYRYYDREQEQWITHRWGYADPETFPSGVLDCGNYIYMNVPDIEYVEIAVTDVPPADIVGPEKMFYQGTDEQIIVTSGMIFNPNGTYKRRPAIVSQTPNNIQIKPGQKTHVTVTFDEKLVLEEGKNQPECKVKSSGLSGSTGTVVENLQWNGATVQFDITLSQMFADDGAFYAIYVTGVVGEESGKAPDMINLGAKRELGCTRNMAAARDWHFFARPELLENEDLSNSNWETSDGKVVANEVKNRIALVATSTTCDQDEKMSELLNAKEPNQTVLGSSTYNIAINCCSQNIVSTGHKLRLSVGFPAGYGPEDEGVTFKAYHFTKDNNGNIVSVEEIPCVITQYGLVITCDKYSPFAIVAVEDDGTASSEKSVIASASYGGTIEGADRENGNIFTLTEGQEKTITARPNEGYEIERITVCGTEIDVTNKEEMSIPVKYDDVQGTNCIVDVSFVAKTVTAKDADRGETVVQQILIPATIEMPTSKAGTINQKLTITPKVEGPAEDANTYQWYKGNQRLDGQTNKTLTIESLSLEDEGSYKLKVTTTVGTETQEVTSTECNVVIKSFETTLTATNQNINLDELEPGDEFEVNINIGNFRNIDGLYGITGRLEYSKDVLDIVYSGDKIIVAQNGWEATTENGEKLKFVTTGDSMTEGVMGKIKFRVKDSITEAATATIALKEMNVSDGDIDIVSADANLSVNVVIPQEFINSTVYTIEQNIIHRIEPKTTVATFKTNVTSQGALVFKDKQGNVLSDDSILATGCTLQVGEKLNYQLAVTQDVNGDGKVTLTDIAKLKLHLVEKEQLTGVYAKAADINGKDGISLTDIAQLKAILVGITLPNE